MAQNSFALMTNLGRAKEAAAIANGTAVVITQIAIGDGTTVPSGGETSLYHEIARKPISGHGTVVGASNVAFFDIFLEAAEGPYTIREAGLVDEDGDLIAIARYDPPINKPIPSSGQTVEGTVRLEVAFSNISAITIVVDPSFKVSLQRLNRLPWLPVLSMGLSAPPMTPSVGDVYVVAAGAIGAWTGQEGKIAEYTSAGWGIIASPDGHGISLPDGRIFEKVAGVYIEKVAIDVQSGKWNYAVAGGSANELTATLVPAPSSLVAGMSVLLKIGTSNNGPTTLNLNGLGSKSVVNVFGAPLSGGELTGLVRFNYDGAKWWSSVITAGLTANRTYYVNSATGNDTNSGLSALSPFATIQRAVNAVSLVNLNGFTATISIADGVYVGFESKPLTGSGNVVISGNLVAPQNVQVNGASGFSGSVIVHPGYKIEGFSPVGNGSGVPNIGCAAPVEIGTMYHRTASLGASHIFAGIGASVTISAKQFVAGDAIAHIYANNGAAVQSSTLTPPAMEFVTNSNFTEGLVLSANGSFVGVTYTSFVAPGLAPGVKFKATVNGVINVNGAGINYFPGASPGIMSFGGQYV